ncbi:SEC7-like protein [Piedraia hortae CBS 480.64]|uniref:SEC7-like protein n=1 Tax=Piedraia hortae CBS 480.64 TaxID=1314780 RepID=A0A6A7BWL8_9PEZI|nr:SEC7-like protein [Piedraia hortae CBS 480.64]
MSDAAFGLSKLRVSTSFDDQPRGRAHERVRSASGEDLKGLTRRPGYAPLPSVRIDEIEASRLNEEIEYRGRARRIFEGDEGDVSQSEAAAWMGEDTEQSSRTLKAYMQLFDFRQMDLLSTLRALCGKLRLSGETQQFDRIISALAERWCQCNPNHGFQAQDVAHTILYSLILLNTDLHVADIGGKMSRAAYVKNTLPTIRRVVTDAAPNAFSETAKAPSTLARPALLWAHSSSSSAVPTSDTSDRSSTDGSASNRLSMWPMSDVWAPSAGANASTTLLSQPWTGSLRAWEVEIEGVLKAFFNSIKSEPLPLLPDTNGADRKLSVTSLGVPRRSRSFSSRSPSEAISFRPKQSLRGMALSWQQRTVRPRPKIYMGSARGSFSRASFDDGGLSKSSLSRALGSPSMDSLGRHTSELAHSVGFANALSQAMIREESTIDSESLSVGAGLLEDEDLALQGAPWAKEGLVKHKHHMESTDRKAKDRGWNDIFAVISKGKLTLFSFKSGTTKTANRHMSRPTVSSAAPRVGGGDWTEQAEQLHYFVLGHCMASVLPPPGYNKTRPHVWALTLPTGAVHLFQVGTPEIAQEFVVTANYWAARLSKEPLVGSVSNLEYGWSDQVINRPPEDTTSPESKHMRSPSNSLIVPLRRPSLAQASIRGSIDAGAAGTRTRLPGDRVVIAQWQPPTQSMTTSSLSEADQLASLQNYIRGVEAELTQHNELKPAIELTYSHRMANYARVSSNWQRKSDYLLRELVKFTSYVDSLHAARAKSEQLRS